MISAQTSSETDTANAADMQVVVFRLGSEEYAVDIAVVREIVKAADVTPVPRAPEWVDGVINLRGKIVPVVDLRRKFGLPEPEQGSGGLVMIVEVERQLMSVRVDAATEVLTISEEQVEPAPDVMRGGGHTDHLIGVAKAGDRLIVLVDLGKALAEPGEESAVHQTDREAAGLGEPEGE